MSTQNNMLMSAAMQIARDVRGLMNFTCDVDKVVAKFQDAFDIVITQNDNSERSDVTYSWRLVPLKTRRRHGVIHITNQQRETEDD